MSDPFKETPAPRTTARRRTKKVEKKPSSKKKKISLAVLVLVVVYASLFALQYVPIPSVESISPFVSHPSTVTTVKSVTHFVANTTYTCTETPAIVTENGTITTIYQPITTQTTVQGYSLSTLTNNGTKIVKVIIIAKSLVSPC